MDDIEHGDRTFQRHMRQASDTLAQCIQRAKAGLPTEAPTGLASVVSLAPKQRLWTESEIAVLRDMRARGRTAGQIALATKRSQASVKAAIRHHWDRQA